ncbi:MAG: hypothetical protein ACXVJB_00195 [Mucilaginibacter sp.]
MKKEEKAAFEQRMDKVVGLVQPILKENGLWDERSFLELKTNRFSGTFAAADSQDVGCHWEYVHGQDENGNPTIIRKWVCPEDGD